MCAKNQLFISYFHNLLVTFWKEHIGSKALNDIFFNKVVSELIRTHKELNFITRGWYLYGIEVAKPSVDQGNFIPTIDELTRGTGFTNSKIQVLTKELISIAESFDCKALPFDWERKQYEDYNEKVYLSKLELQLAIKSKGIKDINRKLSNLSLNLNLKKYNFQIGAMVLLKFIDVSKKVIISNSYSIPNFKKFVQAFDGAWKCFASVNLYLTAEGLDAEKIKVNTSKKIESACKKAEQSYKELSKDIKIKKFHIKIKPDNIEKEILRKINRV